MGGMWSGIAYLPAISLFFAAASLGLPGTVNFVGEFLILIGTFASAPWITAIATSGLVFGSVYSLIMIHRAYFGPTKRSEEHTSELQSLMRISYAVFCLKKKKKT